jgi:hypothetical protein
MTPLSECWDVGIANVERQAQGNERSCVDPQDPRLGRQCALVESSGVHKAPALYNSSTLHPLSRE